MKPTIGILGGIGPESSALFYKCLIEKVQQQGITSNTEYPHIILESVPAPELVLENKNLTLYKQGILNLERAGADFIVIVCNTAYLFLEEFQKLVNIPILNLKEEVEKELAKHHLKEVTIIGSKKTMLNLFTFKTIKIKTISLKDAITIDHIILDYNLGVKNQQKEKLLTILQKYKNNTLLIACTELSMLLKDSHPPYLDTFTLLLKSTLEKWNNS